MGKNLQNIEALFRSSLEHNEDEIPSDKSWDLIEKRLDKENLAVIKRKNIKLKRLAILLMIFLCVAVFELTDQHLTQKRVSADNKISGLPHMPNTATKEIHRIDKTINSDSVNVQKLKKEIDKTTNVAIRSTVVDPIQKIVATDIKQGQTTKLNLPGELAKNVLKTYKIHYTQSRSIINNILDQDKEIQSAFSSDKDNTIKNSLVLERLENAQSEKNNYGKKVQVVLPKRQQSLSAQIGFSNIAEKPGTKPSTKINQQKPGFSIMPFFSPEFASYTLSDERTTNQSQNSRTLEKNETHLFSYTLGIGINYKINDHWGIYSGVSLLRTNISLEPQMIYAMPDNMGNIKYRVNTSSGYGYLSALFNPNPARGDSLLLFNAAHKLRYLSIPAGLTYSVKMKKIDFNLQVGLSVNFLTKATLGTSIKSGMNHSTESINSLQGLKNGYLSGLAGIGIDYNWSDKMAIVLNPVFRFAVSSINKDYAVASFPKSLGFNLGLKYRL